MHACIVMFCNNQPIFSGFDVMSEHFDKHLSNHCMFRQHMLTMCVCAWPYLKYMNTASRHSVPHFKTRKILLVLQYEICIYNNTTDKWSTSDVDKNMNSCHCLYLKLYHHWQTISSIYHVLCRWLHEIVFYKNCWFPTGYINSGYIRDVIHNTDASSSTQCIDFRYVIWLRHLQCHEIIPYPFDYNSFER